MQDIATKHLETESNVVMIPVMDTYANLTRKVKEGIHWIIKNGNPRWLLKIDDDNIAKLEVLENYLKSNFSDVNHLYMGAMMEDSVILRKNSKWAETNYKKDNPLASYPKYANGCTGYILSNSIIRYIGDNSEKLFNYHNEDTAIGIWINESSIAKKGQITYVDETNKKWLVFHSNFYCKQPKHRKYLVMGHNLSPVKIRKCYNYLFKKNS